MKTKYYSDYYVENYSNSFLGISENAWHYGDQIHNRLIGIDKNTALCIFNKRYYLCNAENLYEQYLKFKQALTLFILENKVYFFSKGILIHYIYVKEIKNIVSYLKYIIRN